MNYPLPQCITVYSQENLNFTLYSLVPTACDFVFLCLNYCSMKDFFNLCFSRFFYFSQYSIFDVRHKPEKPLYHFFKKVPSHNTTALQSNKRCGCEIKSFIIPSFLREFNPVSLRLTPPRERSIHSCPPYAYTQRRYYWFLHP